ncbi:WD40 repeat-like protein [Rickenella mellea]|uniref:methylated diphthine methylhydrolase n=1 Tax=Rickenella mellea TaxID=50990 RepID=A0A4Y7QMH8_9AGAM|nr:WD40 repeat-like protein [Rickenella mellea]
MPADSIEFCPIPGAQRIFACGTYLLEQSQDDPGDEDITPKPNQRRRGQCMIFETSVYPSNDFQLIYEFDSRAVLDMKWCHSVLEEGPLLAISTSNGKVLLHHWDIERRLLKFHDSIICSGPGTLCLSIDWSNRRFAHGVGDLTVSLSDGHVSLLRPSQSSILALSDSWCAHDFECWVSAWNYWDTNVVFSGGDDLKLKAWDIRQDFTQPLFTNSRFEAGVTTIQSHPHIEHVIAVGSYNNSVRLFDLRKPLVPIVDMDVGGGCWRVKWHPDISRKSDLLVACMHDGFKVLRFPDLKDGTELPSSSPGTAPYTMNRYDVHKSLAYGVDWAYQHVDERNSTVASCSFYDCSLHTWKA